MRLWHYCFIHISNAQIIQVSKLVNRIKLLNAAIGNSNNNLLLSDSETGESKLVVNRDIDIAALFNKIKKNIEYFYNTYIESKYIRIVKHKPMTLMVQKLKKIHTNL